MNLLPSITITIAGQVPQVLRQTEKPEVSRGSYIAQQIAYTTGGNQLGTHIVSDIANVQNPMVKITVMALAENVDFLRSLMNGAVGVSGVRIAVSGIDAGVNFVVQEMPPIVPNQNVSITFLGEAILNDDFMSAMLGNLIS